MAANVSMTQDISLASLSSALRRFLAWERRQCSALIPDSAAAWLAGRGAREAVVKAGASELILPGDQDGQDIRISGAEIAESTLDVALARRKLSRRSFALVLELPASAFLIRRLDLPAAARGHMPQVIQSEIERKTPFRRGEVFAGWRVDASEAKKMKAVVALLRRDLIAPALEGAGLVLADLAAIRANRACGAASSESSWTPAIELKSEGEAKKSFARISLALTALAPLLVVAGLAAIFWRQSEEALVLDAQIEAMSARAAHVRQAADRATKESRLLSALRETRLKNPPLTDLWEEISRLTPDSAYLTDFHLSESKAGERSVDLSGFAQSAVGLPLLFDGSRYFAEAALTAPITSDPKEKRESFSVRLKLRTPPLATSAQAAAAPSVQPAAEATR